MRRWLFDPFYFRFPLRCCPTVTVRLYLKIFGVFYRLFAHAVRQRRQWRYRFSMSISKNAAEDIYGRLPVHSRIFVRIRGSNAPVLTVAASLVVLIGQQLPKSAAIWNRRKEQRPRTCRKGRVSSHVCCVLFSFLISRVVSSLQY